MSLSFLLPVMPPLAGVKLATAQAGIKYAGRDDVMLMLFDQPASIAGVFTRSLTASAAVDRCRRHLHHGRVRAILVNSGNANAFTGRVGEHAVTHTVEDTAQAVGCLDCEVFPSSTGVIGVPLPAEKIKAVLPQLVANAHADGWEAAAKAIMTTDAYPKYTIRQCVVQGQPVTLQGIAKGAGMIAPDMATMLAYIVTDISLPHDVLQPMLQAATAHSFNAITVDGDTSTSDTVLLAATHAIPAGKGMDDWQDMRLRPFVDALFDLMLDLAKRIVADGEGATKLVQITVEEAESDAAAHIIAKAVANSPLVKTALAGCDPNWGRIVAAIGKAGQRAERDLIWIRFGDMMVAEEGAVHPQYQEAEGAAYFEEPELHIHIGVGVGKGRAYVWTCDLGHEYVRINADYRS